MPFLLPLLTLFTSVGKADPVARPDRSEPTAQTPAPTGTQTPQEATLRAADLCPGTRDIQGIQTTRLVDGRALLQVQCAMFAYQGAYAFAWAESGQPLRDQGGEILHLVGLPTLAPDGSLTNVERARGAGGCGSYVRYALEGERFILKEHRSRACDAGPDAPPPEQWPRVGEASKTSHCAPDETVYFSCSTSRTKVVSLCGSADRLQYRFGPLDAPELRFPADSRPEAFTIEHPSTLQFEADVATFRTDGVTYEVAEARGAGGPNGETNNFAGVTVRRGDDLLAGIPCTGAVTSSWEALLHR